MKTSNLVWAVLIGLGVWYLVSHKANAAGTPQLQWTIDPNTGKLVPYAPNVPILPALPATLISTDITDNAAPAPSTGGTSGGW